MKLIELRCPNCNGELKVNPEKEKVICGYCHTEFKIDDEIKKIEISNTIHHVYTDNAKIKEIEMKEENEKNKAKQEHIGTIILVVMVIALFAYFGLYFGGEERKSNNQEKELQQIVENVKYEVSQGNFEEAYLKAKSINYTAGWSSKIEEKWEKTRKEMIDYVIREEKKATGKSEHKSESGFFDNLFDGN